MTTLDNFELYQMNDLAKIQEHKNENTENI